MSDDERMPQPPASGPDSKPARPDAAAPVVPSAAPAAEPFAAPPGPITPAKPLAAPAAPFTPSTPLAGSVSASDSAQPTAALPAPAAPGASVEGPSPDIQLADEASPLPGAHRGGFQRLPTAPVAVTVETAPAEPGTEDVRVPVLWAPEPDPVMQRGLAGWALAFAVIGLIVALFVGWGFPLGIVAIVSGIFALRRPLESRAMAIWAMSLGLVSLLYSVGWLLFAASRANLLG
ncbi:hypothetical protein [Microbacterium yannicii]|uniref:hypothetical protein n=1 Tax=Microbacterium yannicii TaxID=671622 RepID=UPI0002F6DE20|nr:hypothetical protein [Microbacterium yannicii]